MRHRVEGCIERRHESAPSGSGVACTRGVVAGLPFTANQVGSTIRRVQGNARPTRGRPISKSVLFGADAERAPAWACLLYLPMPAAVAVAYAVLQGLRVGRARADARVRRTPLAIAAQRCWNTCRSISRWRGVIDVRRNCPIGVLTIKTVGTTRAGLTSGALSAVCSRRTGGAFWPHGPFTSEYQHHADDVGSALRHEDPLPPAKAGLENARGEQAIGAAAAGDRQIAERQTPTCASEPVVGSTTADSGTGPGAFLALRSKVEAIGTEGEKVPCAGCQRAQAGANAT
jgi:hypothetical protein